jgi:ectoine hydroxylase-related dioxygenase (phytanoyl-CoA dioxygenase family)
MLSIFYGKEYPMLSDDERFLFDTQGYLHLRRALLQETVAAYLRLVEENRDRNVNEFNEDSAYLSHQLNRPLSRMIDADLRFAALLDHPAVEQYLVAFLGADYRHIDNDMYFTHPGYKGGHWHRGVQAHPTGHVVNAHFICPMVKVFFCLTDVGPDEGEFVVIPGSHKSSFAINSERVDLPGQHVFDTVQAGDVIVFNEALLHNGRPNFSEKTRITLIVNFGRADAGPWPGYRPKNETLSAVTPRQHQILTPGSPVWQEPVLG